jgi:phosphate-selective porin OprO/OprP
LDHLNSSRYNVFIERPFVIEAINQDARRLGIASYGVSEDQAWNWRYGIYNQRLIQDEGNYISDHYQMEFASRVANTIWYDECSGGRGYAHWGISGTIADPDGTNNGSSDPDNLWGRADNEARFRTRPEARTVARWIDTGAIEGADDYEMLGLEGVVNVGPCQVVGEYQNLWLQRNGGRDLHFHGGYAYVSYFLTGEHIPWDRESGTLGRVEPFENFFLVNRCGGGTGSGCGAWQVAVRWSYADFSDEDILGGIGDSITGGLNWHWNAYARMQFNYIYGNIHSHEPVAGQTFGDYHILGTRFMVDF